MRCTTGWRIRWWCAGKTGDCLRGQHKWSGPPKIHQLGGFRRAAFAVGHNPKLRHRGPVGTMWNSLGAEDTQEKVWERTERSGRVIPIREEWGGRAVVAAVVSGGGLTGSGDVGCVGKARMLAAKVRCWLCCDVRR